ncbi:hypothetical protein P344_01840 [Spiroplasma mirum ATCC 29335]|uniref:Uncharacterized protein n=1 Tax=Spiroplasma mirum ATCC 29335 TaxID=838561 RepID=W0GQE1_9MOLU|nr:MULTISPECIES: hypothetical protein [Spiroplasma]AHF60756.1 hypothetical protein SMM_0305 [Spiroplasma mirum ATCC 29335]AHI57716.1 hypothetical protein P344_01840 [Spiroplasma mirum ATCC 29335]AKM52875.1 hypothetical protein SATRI_v1c03480 [Spiroplasma atrichopogonis]
MRFFSKVKEYNWVYKTGSRKRSGSGSWDPFNYKRIARIERELIRLRKKEESQNKDHLYFGR